MARTRLILQTYMYYAFSSGFAADAAHASVREDVGFFKSPALVRAMDGRK